MPKKNILIIEKYRSFMPTPYNLTKLCSQAYYYYMKDNKYFLIVLLTVATAVILLPTSAAAEITVHPFSRYQIILDRKPFGEPPPPPPAPTQPHQPVREEPPFTQNLRLVALSETDFGLRIGIVDVAEKKNYYLSVGDVFNGIKILEASFEDERVLLSKDDEQLWLYTGRRQPTEQSSARPANASRQPQTRQTQRMPAPPGSYRARMQQRAEEEKRHAEEMRRRREQAFTPPELTGEDLQRHLREYNLELIRKAARGEAAGPPLPMELTEEEDEMLVQEGVLPPPE